MRILIAEDDQVLADGLLREPPLIVWRRSCTNQSDKPSATACAWKRRSGQ